MALISAIGYNLVKPFLLKQVPDAVEENFITENWVTATYAGL